MSNALKKTMVFLGLAEEDLEDQNATAQQPTQSVQQSSVATPAAKPQNSRPAPQRAAVTPLRRVTPTRQAGAPVMNEILTVHPAEYRDAKSIAEGFRDGLPVIINLSRMNEPDAKRLIDFASGLTMGLNGRIERVTSKVFLLTPEHIEVGSDESAPNDSGSFFVTPTA
ncbi:cell division protein SepF [Leucobacter coleopterorum]|uniref:Cell division protein SepF n=1 Tax=Leucobacter coleopterorum TaxID=2714933 RepID=A0ABX6JWH8_9MICO|nr:cell division protein SepF [Leucobacter coleopterorum]QIM18331.1 cell division protein SepF [Leucobacter coleopterorum]